MFERAIIRQLVQALNQFPVVLLQGARQTGKSTLAQSLIAKNKQATYITLDDEVILSRLRRDPRGFLSELKTELIVIDEVQRAPEIFTTLKLLVDQDRRPGRFLLTGSAQILQLPKLSESLAGRMYPITLWSLAQAEIESHTDNFIDRAFGTGFTALKSFALSRQTLIDRMIVGGFPEVVTLTSPQARRMWFDGYISTVLQRDIRGLAEIQKTADLPQLLSLAAARAAQTLNVTDISRSVGIPQTTLRDYLALFERTYLTTLIQPWFKANLGKRLLKSPKLMLADSGLLAHLTYADNERLLQDAPAMGALLENFVAMELIKLSTWSEVQPRAYHFRTYDNKEVDVVLEGRGGKVVGIEVKATQNPGDRDFAGLLQLAEAAGKSFVRGCLLYTGQQVIPWHDNIYAVPISALWQH